MRVHVKLDNLCSMMVVYRALLAEQPILVSFAAQMTHHPILIVPDTIIRAIGFPSTHIYEAPYEAYTGGKLGDYFYIGVVEFGRGLYPFPRQGHIDWSYFNEKIRMNSEADAVNITIFLNALRHPKGVEYYLSHVPLDGDHVNWDVFNARGGQCIYVQ